MFQVDGGTRSGDGTQAIDVTVSDDGGHAHDASEQPVDSGRGYSARDASQEEGAEASTAADNVVTEGEGGTLPSLGDVSTQTGELPGSSVTDLLDAGGPRRRSAVLGAKPKSSQWTPILGPPSISD